MMVELDEEEDWAFQDEADDDDLDRCVGNDCVYQACQTERPLMVPRVTFVLS